MLSINDIVKIKNRTFSYKGAVIQAYPITIAPIDITGPIIQFPINYPVEHITSNKAYKFKHYCSLNLYSVFVINNIKEFFTEVNCFLNRINPFHETIQYNYANLTLVITGINGVKCYSCIDKNNSKNKFIVPEYLLLKYGTNIEDEHTFNLRDSYFSKNDRIEFYLSNNFKTYGIIQNISYFDEFTNEYFYDVITTSLPVVYITISESDIISKSGLNTSFKCNKVLHIFKNNDKISIKIDEKFINEYLKETCNNFNKGREEFLYELKTHNILLNQTIHLTLQQHSEYDNFYYDAMFRNKILLPEKPLTIFK